MPMKYGIEVKAIDAANASIHLFDEVGGWEGDANYFKDQLEALGDVQNIDLHINSPGGSVFEGLAIFNQLKAHPAQITVYIDGLAASMASYIAMAGDLVVMPENAMMMIHNPNMVAYGEERDMDKAKDILSTAKRAMLGAYMAKSGKTEQEISDIMDAETWLSGVDAVEMGFADVLEKPVEIAACTQFDLKAYHNAPEFLKPSAVADKSRKKGGTMPQATTNPATEGKPVDIAEVQAKALQAEQNRRTEIKAAFKGFEEEHRTLMDACLDDMKITTEQAQAKLLAALGAANQEPVASVGISMGRSEESKKLEGMQKALEIQAGLSPNDAANPFRSMSMKEMAAQTLQMHGQNIQGLDKMTLVGNAFTHTGGDFGNLLRDTANKAMLKGYDEAQESFEQFCSVGSAPDFKPMSRVDIGTFPTLAKVRDGAEYQYATMGDRAEQIQLATYGKMFAITRQTIINDDLGAFTRIPAKMGMAAKRTIGDLVFAILTGNPVMADGTALFHASHKNLGSGALNTANLDALRTLMRKQKDGDAVLNIRPEFLIVPAALEGAAMQVINSEFEVGAAKNATVPNAVRNIATVISDARLDDSSSTAFYLMAGKMFDTIEVAYLDGRAAPRLEEKAGWNVDGTEFKVSMDAGVKALDYRTMAKSTGA